MGFYFAFSPCYGRSRPFSYNPELVPSIMVEGVREPVCAVCVERANPQRVENGLEPIRPLPGAYEPAGEGPDEYPC